MLLNIILRILPSHHGEVSVMYKHHITYTHKESDNTVTNNQCLYWKTIWKTGTCTKFRKMARGLKFQIGEVEGLFYLCSKNKGPDQLHSYHVKHGNHTADQCLCFFRIRNKSCRMTA